MAVGILEGLRERGFEIEVASATGPTDYAGIRVRDWSEAESVVVESDVIFTHLNQTTDTMGLTRKHNKPLVHVVHNHRSLAVYGVRQAALIVPNTHWLEKATRGQAPSVPRVVVYPPTFPPETPRGRSDGAVVLVNRTQAKGVSVFYRMAHANPDRRFIAVDGAYGNQVRLPPHIANLEAWPNRAGLDELWPETAVLAAPSTYESFGKAAVEALGHCIPVLAAPTPGLKEALGRAGVFVGIRNYHDWSVALRQVLESGEWERRSQLSRIRADALAETMTAQLDELAEAVRGL